MRSLRDIDLKEHQIDRYYHYESLNKVRKAGEEAIQIIYSNHLTFLWEKNSIFYLIKLQNNPSNLTKTPLSDISDTSFPLDFTEFYTFERLNSSHFLKEGSRISAYFAFPENDPEESLLYQYSMEKLSDFTILKKNSGVIFSTKKTP